MSTVNVNAIDKESGSTLTLGGSGTQVTLHASATSSGFTDEGMKNDIAILGFKVAANGSLSKYNLVDQTIDDFQDTSGIDASASTNDERNASDYYIGSASGSITQYTASGTHTATSTGTATILIVGAGAGGGYDLAGGGGAGGAREITQSLTSGTGYTVTIGTGGSGSTSNSSQGSNGGSSVFDSTTVTGGGGGASRSSSVGSTTDGSGGGGAGVYGSSNTGGGGGNYGNSGGNSAGSNYPGGGGGGAGAAGANATVTSAPNGAGGNGGAGQLFSTFSSYGVSGYFAGGGGGASSGVAAGSGGSGGGADGGTNAGTANTGGGGGGGGGGGSGGAGGTGVVIVKDANVPGNLTLVSTATTAEAVPTKGDLVMTYTNGAGTATINTDIKGWVSRDNGTTYTQFTLADEGDTGGHTILTAHDLDISAQPSGSAMRYKITTHNQSASKETRIQAVSLGWL